MQIPLVGASNRSRMLNLTAQRVVNFYPEKLDGGPGKASIWFEYTPGVAPFVRLPGGRVTGLWAQDGRCFAVSGQYFCEIFPNHTFLVRGQVREGFYPVTMCSNGPQGHQLLVVAGLHGHIFDLNTNVFSQINNLAPPGNGFPVPCRMCAFVDGYFLALKDQSVQFNISALFDGLTWDPLDVAQVSQSTDKLQSMVVNHREVWLFGSKTTVPWVDTGATFPFEPYGGTFIEAGTAAGFSVTRVDNSLLWVGADERGHGIVWRADGYTPQRVSTHAVEWQLSKRPYLHDIVGFAYQEIGHTFYWLYIPNAETSWVYDIGENLWHERALWDTQYEQWIPHLARCHAFAFENTHLVGDRQSGTVYEMALCILDDTLVIA